MQTIDRETQMKIKQIVEAEGQPPNIKTLSIVPDSEITTEQLQGLLAIFGSPVITQVNNEFRVEFEDTVQAYLAKETLNRQEIEGLLTHLTVDWDRSNVTKIHSFEQKPNTYYPVLSDRKGTPKTLESVKYRCIFPIDLPNAQGFNLKNKILGGKSCNIMKVLDHCSKDAVLPEKHQDFLKIKLIEDEFISIKVTSRYQDKYRQAVTLLLELINNIIEEYNRFCERSGIIPYDFRVRQFESVKGRARAFREGTADPTIYNVNTINL